MRVIYPVAKWVEVYGDGQFQLIHRRAGDSAPYPVAVTVDGGNVLWDVSSADTAVVGTGACELQYYVGDVLAKSKTWETRVLPALDDTGPVPPEPEQSWVEQVLEAAVDAEEAADKAAAAAVHQPTVGDNGNWWVWDQESGEYVDTGKPTGGDYSKIDNKPSINGVTLNGNLSFETLGEQTITNSELADIVRQQYNIVFGGEANG